MLESVKSSLFRGDSKQIYKLGKYRLQELKNSGLSQTPYASDRRKLIKKVMTYLEV